MSVSDSDLELIESHLDGELSVADEEALRDRMNIEPELGSTLETLAAERDARRGAFLSMEPDEAAVERFTRYASRKLQRIDRESFWRTTASRLRIVSAAAACLVIGFSIGRIADSGVLNRQPGEKVAAANPSAPPYVEVLLTDEGGKQLGVQRFTSEQEARAFVTDCERACQQQHRMHNVHLVPTTQEDQF
jgi:anti-sigma factor RsiW